MIPSFIVVVLTGIAGTVGYGFLFDSIFFYRRPMKSPPAGIRLLGALSGPPLLAFILVFCIGTPAGPDRMATIVGAALFPCFALLPILFVRLFLTAIQSSAKESVDEIHDVENKLAPGFGGCLVPFVLFVAIFVLSGFMGVKLHDYNPFMDGPPPEIRVCGIDMVKVVDFFMGMTLWAFMFTFLFEGIRLGLHERKKRIEAGIPPKKTSLVEIIVVIGIIGLLAGLLLPAVTATREGGRYSGRRSCENNLVRLSFAMSRYHQQHGTFPSAYTTDANGKPLHSWRVLLLPYIYDEKWDSWYKEIRLDEPWDSEHNKRFHRIPKSKFPGRDFSPFCCPEAAEKQSVWSFIFDEPDDRDTDRCDYSVIVGPSGLFPGAEVGGKDYSRDNNYADQLLLVERRSPICWMDPTQEITEADAEKGINTLPEGIGSTHHSGAYAIYGDQHVELLPPGPLKSRKEAETYH